MTSPTDYRPPSSYGRPDPATLLAPGSPIADHRPTIRQHDSLFLNTTAPTDESARSGTMVSGDYAFNPEYHGHYVDQPHSHYDSRTATLMDSQRYFSDFAGQQHAYDQMPDEYGGPPALLVERCLLADGCHGASNADGKRPSAPDALEYQMPLEPRDLPRPSTIRTIRTRPCPSSTTSRLCYGTVGGRRQAARVLGLGQPRQANGLHHLGQAGLARRVAQVIRRQELSLSRRSRGPDLP